MIIEIIKRTPPWVFFLFFVLLAIGLKHAKDRTIKEIKIITLPATMIFLSLLGTLSDFGYLNINAFTFWITGLAAAGALNPIMQHTNGVTYSFEQKTFNLPGSWWPLSLMMAIFFIKYTMGVIRARKLSVLNEPGFIPLISFSYGFLSGMFLFRAYAIWRSKNNSTNNCLTKRWK